MRTPPVVIVRGGSVKERCRAAFDALQVGRRIAELATDDVILVKPNLARCLEADAHSGAYEKVMTVEGSTEGDATRAETLDCVLEGFRECWPGRLIVAEGAGGCQTPMAFEQHGIRPVVDHHRAELVDLNRSPARAVAVDRPLLVQEFRVADAALDAAFLVSLCSLKNWGQRGISMGLKNMFGILPGKHYGWNKGDHSFVDGALSLSHRGANSPNPDEDELAKTVVDICTVRAPDLSIVDGTTALHGQWQPPEDRRLERRDLLVAGFDPVAVDAVGAQLMGYDPSSLNVLRWAEERGLGAYDTSQARTIDCFGK